MVFLFVLGRILSNAWANVLQKQLGGRGVDPLLIVAVSFTVLMVLVLPSLVVVPLAGLSLAFWGTMALAALFDTPGNVLLVRSVALTDLSLIGPLNAYKPIVALLLAMVTLGEVPNAWGILGVGIIFMGSLFLSPGGEGAGLQALRLLARDRGVQLRLLSLVMTATAAVILKAALAEATPLQTLLAWAFTNTPIALLAYRFLTRPHTTDARPHLRQHGRALFGIGLLFLLMQLLTIQLFTLMHVAYALALFQLGALVNVFFGYRVFQEQHILRRALGSTIMVVGAALLILYA